MKENKNQPVDCSNDTTMVLLGLRAKPLVIEREVFEKSLSERVLLSNHKRSFKKHKQEELRNDIIKAIISSNPQFNFTLKIINYENKTIH